LTDLDALTLVGGRKTHDTCRKYVDKDTEHAKAILTIAGLLQSTTLARKLQKQKQIRRSMPQKTQDHNQHE
jgi:hypothetical protein